MELGYESTRTMKTASGAGITLDWNINYKIEP